MYITKRNIMISMTKKQVYKIIFNNNFSVLGGELDHVSTEDKLKILNMPIESYFDCFGDDKILYIISTLDTFERYLNNLQVNRIEFKSMNISTDILSYSEPILRPKITQTIKWGMFSKDLNDWVRTNISIDSLVSKVCTKDGYRSLSDLEKEIFTEYTDC